MYNHSCTKSHPIPTSRPTVRAFEQRPLQPGSKILVFVFIECTRVHTLFVILIFIDSTEMKTMVDKNEEEKSEMNGENLARRSLQKSTAAFLSDKV